MKRDVQSPSSGLFHSRLPPPAPPPERFGEKDDAPAESGDERLSALPAPTANYFGEAFRPFG